MLTWLVQILDSKVLWYISENKLWYLELLCNLSHRTKCLSSHWVWFQVNCCFKIGWRRFRSVFATKLSQSSPIPSSDCDIISTFPPASLLSTPDETLQRSKKNALFLLGEKVLEYNYYTNISIVAEMIYKLETPAFPGHPISKTQAMMKIPEQMKQRQSR